MEHLIISKILSGYSVYTLPSLLFYFLASDSLVLSQSQRNKNIVISYFEMTTERNTSTSLYSSQMLHENIKIAVYLWLPHDSYFSSPYQYLPHDILSYYSTYSISSLSTFFYLFLIFIII